ncbi:hypothetical protein F4780DRAFT_782594 [Xylariomycetidae sp. FL0641]|nr:hypothetical protein F4780DRAFT_782594 [Xylariomycetidae sp. FL0641]
MSSSGSAPAPAAAPAPTPAPAPPPNTWEGFKDDINSRQLGGKTSITVRAAAAPTRATNRGKGPARWHRDQEVLLPQTPVVRPVEWRAGWAHAFNGNCAENYVAAMGYRVGDETAAPCGPCAAGKGPFARCVRAPAGLRDQLKYGRECYNCVYNQKQRHCDLGPVGEAEDDAEDKDEDEDEEAVPDVLRSPRLSFEQLLDLAQAAVDALRRYQQQQQQQQPQQPQQDEQ